MNLENFHVAVIGAGPAGLFAAQKLAQDGATVVIFNRDIKPGGLAEYGIYPDKHKMKQGLRAQFDKILGSNRIVYLGNVVIGNEGALTLDDLFQLGFDAVLVTVGAQGTKSLGLPGEEFKGVYHAKDLVYYYNQLPTHSERAYEIGQNVLIIGVGNVMMDIAHWLVRERKVETVTAVARRGPAEVKFDKKEFETVGANVDVAALDAEIERCAPIMLAVGQDPAAARAEILAGLPRALPPISTTRLLFRFLASPHALCGDENKRVSALEAQENTLVKTASGIQAKGLGRYTDLLCDTVIFAIGDRVDPSFGLPLDNGEFVKNPNPRFPIEGESYEAFDPAANAPLQGVFVAGWARRASTGLVGVARKDGTNGALAVEKYLETRANPAPFDPEQLQERLAARNSPVVTKADLLRLLQAESEQARRRGLPEFKYATNHKMLQVIRE